MFPGQIYESRVETIALPNELWLIIFDIVIEEGIIWLDQCDYTTFPHVGPSFSSSARCHQFYDSYYRLRLVCRRFSILLGARPWQSFSDSSALPFPLTPRSLYLDLKRILYSHLRRLCAETSTFGLLVSLDVDCGISPSYLLEASAGQAFPNVRRLVLTVERMPHCPPDGPFWPQLRCAFPLLVTFILRTEYWNFPGELQWKEGDEIICFEWLEILYFSSQFPYLGCHFPRLRHASIWGCSSRELQILLRSPHLESLLIRSYFLASHRINLASCSRLKLLGFDYDLFTQVVPLGLHHPVEHICLYRPLTVPDLDVFPKLWRMAPNAHRIIMEFSSPDRQSCWRESYEQIGRKPDSFGTFMLPPVHGDHSLTFQRQHGDHSLTFEREEAPAEVVGGVVRKVWSKIRR